MFSRASKQLAFIKNYFFFCQCNEERIDKIILKKGKWRGLLALGASSTAVLKTHFYLLHAKCFSVG